jgi:hypothetical protein
MLHFFIMKRANSKVFPMYSIDRIGLNPRGGSVVGGAQKAAEVNTHGILQESLLAGLRTRSGEKSA